MNDLITIIVPCYMQAEYLDEALLSVYNQTYKNWECIIVNDGSTDRTEHVASDWLLKDQRFKYYKIKNNGVAAARNYAINQAAGTFILPLDADDVLSNNYLKEVYSNFNQLTKVVYGKLEMFGFENKTLNLPQYNLQSLIFSNMIHVAGLFKKSDFLQTNGYDSNMKSGYEDWELWINMLKTGGNAINVDTATLFYRTKQQSRMTGIDYKKGYLLKAYIYHKHRELYNDLIAKQYLEININFLYSFYLSAKIYKHDNIKTLKKYFNNKLKKELNQYSFFLKKKILFGWFLKNKIGITLIDVLFR